MTATRNFLKIVHNGERKVMQRAKLPPFLKHKHPAVRNTLLIIAALRWGLNTLS